MSKPVDDRLHLQRHARMVEYQKQIHPFIPTVRELAELWELNTTSSVVRTLNRLVDLGLCITREHGESKSYFAVEPNAPRLAHSEGIDVGFHPLPGMMAVTDRVGIRNG